MALTGDTLIDYEIGDINEPLLAPSAVVYKGSAVGYIAASGLSRALVAGDDFGGFALYGAVQADGDERVKVRERGKAVLDVDGSDATKVNDLVYAADDATFTLTSTDNSLIGRIHRHISGTTCVVEFYPKVG